MDKFTVKAFAVLGIRQSHIFMCPAWLSTPLCILGGENFLSKNKGKNKNEMTVEEAGHMGGQKVKKLIEEGKEHEEE
jgi:hypothetical protein